MASFSDWLAGGGRTPVRLAARERQIFVRTGGGGDACCTLLHGFPTSSHDWHRVWEPLCRQRRLLAFDFLGFGDSDKPPEHDYTIHEQADITEALWRTHGVRRTVLVAHDYGVSVAQELLARLAEGRLAVAVTRAVFLNGGLYPELHRPQPAQLILLDPVQGPQLGQLMTEETFGRGLSRTFGPSHQPTPDELREQWLAVTRHDGHRIGHRLIQYIPDRKRHRDRWVGALETTRIPRHFLWGDLDPVSGAHMADGIAERIPAADLVRFADVGHWPQLEVPAEVEEHLGRILATDVE
jgi:pimeloyl-ACP methyl ester carboxylesterase